MFSSGRAKCVKFLRPPWRSTGTLAHGRDVPAPGQGVPWNNWNNPTLGRLVRSGDPASPSSLSGFYRPLEGSRVCLTLFCLLVLTVVLPLAGLLSDLDRASTARTLAAVQARRHDEDPR